MHPSIPLVPVRRLGDVASVLLLVVCATFGYVTAAVWQSYSVVTDYFAGMPSVGDADLYAADDTVATAYLIAVLASLGTGVVFLVWLWRARTNADHMSAAHHRLSRGWVIGAWFCPIVNLWFPRRIVDDIWRTSRPGVPTDQYRIEGLPLSPLIRVWWLLILVNYALQFLANLELKRPVHTPDQLLTQLETSAVYITIGTVLMTGAAVALITVIRQIGRWQVHSPTMDEAGTQA